MEVGKLLDFNIFGVDSQGIVADVTIGGVTAVNSCRADIGRTGYGYDIIKSITAFAVTTINFFANGAAADGNTVVFRITGFTGTAIDNSLDGAAADIYRIEGVYERCDCMERQGNFFLPREVWN